MSGRVVLVTGGAKGIGLACAQRFAANGDQVESAFETIESKLGPVEVLVGNAAINRDTLLLRMSEADFTSVIDANLTGTFRVVKRATQGMLRARKGRIVLMSSVVGMLGSAGQANYAASKAGLIGFARSLARELSSRASDRAKPIRPALDAA